MRITAIAFLLSALTLAAADTRGFHDNQEPTMNCENNSWGDRARSCEVREQTIASTGSLNIDPGTNGGVTIRGWSRSNVLVRAKVEAQADSAGEAHALATAVSVQAAAGDVRASGPATSDGRSWSVSYEIFVPHLTNVTAKANNGGIHVTDVGGTMQVETQNGGVHLARLTGDVKAVTVNGGVHVELMGDHWEGRGLDASSTNGGVHVSVPDGYSAQFESSTVNGGVRSDFAALAPASDGHKRATSISAMLGGGGATVRATTVNGGVDIVRGSGE
jgi:DUF4097 and DUF4098 domain-containing protein YvlB